MSITVLAVGKKHESWVQDGIERYEKRLQKPFDVQWVLLPHSSFDGDRARQEESERILLRIKDGEYVVLLDERGENITSPALSARISDAQMEARRIVVVIGGAYGVDERVHARANFIWSLSKLVFPPQLVRVILAEQLYRAQEIARGGGYHHE
jgi:23S rRNA (pseudouridine1915-N3)-methyltransferase